MQHKKALVAAAITASLALSATASAEVDVYGKIHTSIAAVSQDDGTDKTSSNEVKSNASRLGFKGSKEMANGMTIVGQAEFQVDWVGDTSKSSTDLITLRNTYVGLKGGFGEVRVGRHDTPHKISTAKLDPFGDTYADYNSIISVDNRGSNVIAYLNKFGDVGVAVAYSAGDDEVTGENENSITSMMVNYSSGPLYLSGALESFADRVDGQNDRATKVGAGYTFGPVALGLVYEIKSFKGDADDDREAYVSMKYKATDTIGINAAYGKIDFGNDATEDKTLAAIGVDYKMDKNAKIYALYASGKDGGLSKGGLAGDSSALSIGIDYKF